LSVFDKLGKSPSPRQLEGRVGPDEGGGDELKELWRKAVKRELFLT